jgi:LmbE family N-acetylglucosaminyl deacetylase
MKNVLAIGAHPDDIEFGCGGTVLNHIESGDRVVYLCMTSTESVDGITGELIRSLDQNRTETRAAAAALGCEDVLFADFKDLHIPFNFESVNAIEAVIKGFEIDTVYTHWAGDANQDHIATFKSTMAAARYVPNVVCYEQIPIPRMSENQMNIDYYVDVTDTFDGKIKASMCHVSQIDKYRKIGLDVENNLRILASFRGIQANCKYAEAFKILKLVN